MKIGLVAFRYHAGVLQMYLELCAAAGVEVVLFTSERLLRDAGQHFDGQKVPAARVVLNSGMTDSEFLRSIARESDGLDALIFVELQFDASEDWNSFKALDFRCPVHAGVHDIVLEPGLEPLPIWRFCDRSLAKLRAAAFARVSRFVVHAPAMRDRFAKEVAPRAVRWLPVYFRDRLFRRQARSAEGPLRVAVTGVYSLARRDYPMVLDVVAQLLERGIGIRVSMVGHPAGPGHAAVVARFERFEKRFPDALIWSREYIEEGSFRSALEASDLVLAPLMRPPPDWERWLPGGSERRVYSLDRHITAATYDAVRFQLPVLYPSFYLGAADRHPGALTFKDGAELADLLAGLAADRKRLADLTADAARYAETFTPEKFAPALKSLLSA